MKIGHSNLLRHLVEAAEIAHDECEGLQIVCPECREPVFKTERGTATGNQHFLSHYGADKAMVAQCELRVGALTAGDTRMSAAEGRGQNLSYFLRVLRQMIEEASANYLVRCKAPAAKIPTVRQILGNAVVCEMLDAARTKFLDTGLDRMMEMSADVYRRGQYDRDYGVVMLDARRQESYAADMARTLYTPACRRDCRVVLAQGWMQAASFLAQGLENDVLDPRETAMARVFLEIPQLSSSSARRKLAREDEGILGNVLVLSTLHAMASLMALNYAGWLARSTAAPLPKAA